MFQKLKQHGIVLERETKKNKFLYSPLKNVKSYVNKSHDAYMYDMAFM